MSRFKEFFSFLFVLNRADELRFSSSFTGLSSS